MSKTEVKIEVEPMEDGKTAVRIGKNDQLLIGFALTKEQMITVFEALTKKIANEESGGVTLTYGDQE